MASAFSGASPDLGPPIALDAQINSLLILKFIPEVLAAGAAYVAWSRIDEGEIPATRH